MHTGRPKTIRALLDAQASMRPHAPFLIAPETHATLSFVELRDRSIALDAYLRERGIVSGEKVGLFMPNGLQTARLFVGAMYGGYTVVPINLLAQGSHLDYVTAHCDSRIIFVAPGESARLRTAAARAGHAIEIVEVDPDDRSFLSDSAPSKPHPPSEADDALLMYTSGTTGVPKGVLLTHANVVSAASFVTAAHALDSSDRVLAVLPLYHINAQIVTVVAPLFHGGSLVMPHRFSASSFWPLAIEYDCTWLNVVPTIVSYLLNGGTPQGNLSKLKFCRSASAPLPVEQQLAFESKFGIGIIETMGLTETAAPCFSNPLERSRRKLGSPGLAFGNEAKVVDPQTGAEHARGIAGEIMVRGPNVTKGYYKSPEATAKALTQEGWLRTGDLGYVDDEGYFFVTGRLKELIIKGGENIAPREIDEALLKHPAVLEAAAVGIPDKHYGQEIMACVVLKASPIDPGEVERELRELCHAELGAYKTPSIIRIVSDLPKGPSGKVQRLKLLELTSSRR